MKCLHLLTDHSKEYEIEERCSIIEILNTAEYASLSVAQAKVLPGVTTMDHALSQTDEIYYVLSGQGTAIINQKEYKLSQGHLLLIPKESHQSITNTGKEDLLFLCICTPRFEQKNYTGFEK